ncbi:hypothetical protein ACWGJQ_25825 [Peribacillus simplex]
MANLKRNMIELVKEVKEGEIETVKYLTPVFIPFSVVYEAKTRLQIRYLRKNQRRLSLHGRTSCSYGQGRLYYIYLGKNYNNLAKPKVTNAKPGQSFHNFGVAIDFFLVSEDGKTIVGY